MNILPHQLQFAREYYAPSRSGSELWSLSALLGILRRRWRTCAGVAVSCICAALLVAALTKPSYTATSVLLIDTKMRPPQPGQAGPSGPDVAIDAGVIETQIEVLRANKIALDVVDRLALAKDPEFVPPAPGPLTRLFASASALFRTDAATGPDPDPRQIAVGTLGEKLRIARSGRSFLAEIAVTTRDPAKSARIANAIAESYIRDQLASRMDASDRTTDWMRHRLEDVRLQVEAADRALRSFRLAHPGCASLECRADTGRPADQPSNSALGEQGQEGSDASGRLDTVEAALTALRSGGIDDALQADLVRLRDPSLAAILSQHAGQGGLITATEPAGQNLLGRLTALRDQLAKQVTIERLKAVSDRAPGAAPIEPAAPSGAGAALRERELELAAQSARDTYQALQNRVARVSSFLQQEALPVTEARVVTSALPPLNKSAPKIGVLLLLGVIGGAAAGAAAAFLREMLDRRLRWPTQVTKDLGQAYLGSFPKIRGSAASFSGAKSAGSLRRQQVHLPLLTAGGSIAALDALRCAKVLIDQATEYGHCRVVGIVSPGLREGKTTVAANLALLMAQMSMRVLVVDADLHGGDLTSALRSEAGGSLTEAVAKRMPLTECISATEHDFDLLAGFSEAVPRHPHGVLTSPETRRLLSEAREAYDYVVIDIPAVLHTVDVRPLLKEVDAFVVAANSGTTTVDDLQSMFTSCPLIEANTVGVILNRSRLPRQRLLMPAPRLRTAM